MKSLHVSRGRNWQRVWERGRNSLPVVSGIRRKWLEMVDGAVVEELIS